MMTTADIVVDTQGRPILLVPAALSDGQTVLTIHENSFDISVDGKKEVELKDIEDEFLIALGTQEKVGIAVQAEGAPMPETIEYVADVKRGF